MAKMVGNYIHLVHQVQISSRLNFIIEPQQDSQNWAMELKTLQYMGSKLEVY